MAHSLAIARTPAVPSDLDGAFLHCVDCVAVHRVSTADRAPHYAGDEPMAADDFERFYRQHRTHHLSWLRRSGEAEVRSHARWDPMCRTSWELTDGERTFIVTSGRSDVEGPREYAISDGRMVLEHEAVEIDAETLTRSIDEALYPHAAPASRLQWLIAVCRKAVASVPPDSLEPIDEDRDDPAVQLACLPHAAIAAMRAEVEHFFEGSDAERLRDVLENDLAREIPVVRLIRRYAIDR